MKIAIISLAAALASSACSTVPAGSPPCHNGWSVNQFGASKLVPVDELSQEVLALIPSGEAVQCAHEIAGGGLKIIVQVPDAYDVISVADIDGAATITQRGRIVGYSY